MLTQPIMATKQSIQVPCNTLKDGFYFAQIIDLQNYKQQTIAFQIQE